MSIKGLLCSTSLVAVLGACAAVPQGHSIPYSYYQQYQQPAYAPPPANYAVNRQPVARYTRWNPAARRFELADMAMMGAGVGAVGAVGAVGGMMANRGMTGAEHIAERAAVGAAERSVATRAAESVVARGVGAAALTAAEEAEGAEILEFIFTRAIWFAL